jgi:hypothetical protein
VLGTVSYVAVTVTARLTSLAARHIISDIGSYYAVSQIFRETLQILNYFFHIDLEM